MFFSENLKKISKKSTTTNTPQSHNNITITITSNTPNPTPTPIPHMVEKKEVEKYKDQDQCKSKHRCSVKPSKIIELPDCTTSQISPDFFIPYQKDKLFWCFYIILFGMEKYEQDVSHSFSVEKKLKIETIEKMAGSQLSQKIKELKIKRIDLENELLSNTDISLKCMYALCAIHSISLTIITGKKYYVFDFDSSSSSSSSSSKNSVTSNKIHCNKIQNVIQRQPSGEFSIYIGTDNILDSSLYLVENVCKPIKSASSYLISDLKELCNKMNIPIIEESNGKHKSKNKLYEDVLLFIKS
jgi:hypothetical protein